MASPNDLSRSSLPPFANQLIESGYITLPQLKQALIEKRKSDRPLLDILPMVTGRPLPPELLQRHRREQLARLKATYGVDCLDPETEGIDWKRIEHYFKTLLPFEICRRYQILPLRKQESTPKVLQLAMVDPANPEILDDLRRILRDRELQFERKAIALADYQKLIEDYRSRQEDTVPPEPSRAERHLETLVDVTDVFEEEPSERPALRSDSEENLGLADHADRGPIVTLVNNLLVRAIESKASEIHLDPDENGLEIRFRQDGVLRTGFDPVSREVGPAILSRLKLLADLEVAPPPQHQRGKMTKTFSGRRIDFHVHTLPGPLGEKMLLRVFDSRSALWTLDELIAVENIRELVRSLLARPSGLLLLSAPARGGSSSSFYSLLASQNQPGSQIATIENPIERTLNGVTQMEIDPVQGVDYPSAWKSLRSRGVKMLGIDRLADRQSASIAIEAARSGHLVLATLTGDSAAEAVTRLSELTDSRSSASVSIGVIHQRLARRVCPVCRLKHDPSPSELARFGLSPAPEGAHQFYKANSLTEEESVLAGEKGRLCRHCNGAGYRGQIAVFEVMALSPHLTRAIADGADADALEKAALPEGFPSPIAYGLALVSAGHTTLGELDRLFGDRLPLPPSPSLTPTTISPTVMKRIEELERLIGALGLELQALKQELTPPASPAPIVYEEIHESHSWKTGQGDRDADRDTIVSDPSLYEELTDPGDWERLKQELDVTKETMVTVDPFDEDDSFPWNPRSSSRSVPDPWS